jgi:hypothetical protein
MINPGGSLLLLLLLLGSTHFTSTSSFIPHLQHTHCNHKLLSTSRLQQSTYGRGAEIWPPANEEPIRLENSFPNGILPDNVLDKIRNLETGLPPPPSESKGQRRRRRPYIPRTIRRILRRAAHAQEETVSEAGSYSAIDKTPIVLAIALVFTGMIRPLDALLVSFLSGYFVILYLWARSLRRDGVTPLLPALPPQGHVPNLVANPLGPGLTNYSMNYDYWLKTGALLGLLGPIVMMIRYAVNQQMECARACARPIFFLCCQAVSEAISRRSVVSRPTLARGSGTTCLSRHFVPMCSYLDLFFPQTPLPIRILVPVAYNTVRLGYLWNWAFLPLEMGTVGRVLAIANLAYWMINLFGFLLPIAVVRYMRAHFFAVEAEQVTTRPGMEDSTGVNF